MLSGCATKPSPPQKDKIQIMSAEQRTELLQNKKKWQLKGKIAFIQKVENDKDKRESATMVWKVNEKRQTQQLNLTSFLGISVLHLRSNQNQHVIKVDGEEYQGSDLSQLIYSLTGLILPSEALTFWLKGLPYNANDELDVDEKTQLPKSISSYYHNAMWQINYDNYRPFNDIVMATKFTIKKDNLLIKVAVNNWSFID